MCLTSTLPRLLSIALFFSLLLVPQMISSEINSQKLGPLKLHLPSDIQISLFASEVPHARHMTFNDQGTLFLSQAKDGKVVALPDLDKNGEADKTVLILENRDNPHGLAFAQLDDGYYLYIAEETQVIRLKRLDQPFKFGKPETIINKLPGGGHFTRTIKIKNNKLYLSVGSSCNVCVEESSLRAAITRFNLDGSGKEVFAEGLRNSVGIEFSPYTGELWGVNNGRDMLGDQHPKEELNIIQQGKHYGWPYCYESQTLDKDFSENFDCSKTEVPAYTFTAHMAPLGMAFYQKGNLNEHYDNSVFISFHGSWNRSVPAGYKVLRLRLDSKGNILSHEDFITGWLTKNGVINGRPVDIEQSPEGDLYLSDDYLGVVYRVTQK
jgi:glucose/arabinose dehydrogenase